jgi:Zn-dependent metalloprotease
VSGGFDPACIADWDSVSYTVGDSVHCLRRVDLDLTVDDQTGAIHHDGQIWSKALFDIHNALGRRTADRIILQAQFDFGVDPSFAKAAQATVDAAESMVGHAAAVTVRNAFEDRGIL